VPAPERNDAVEQMYVRRRLPSPAASPVPVRRAVDGDAASAREDRVSRRSVHTIASLVDAPVQRKPLVSGKLNVAGETHGESDGRRGPEAQYAAENAPGGYWTESQFTAASSVFATARHGDPIMLRAEYLLAVVKEKWIQRLVVPFKSGKAPQELGEGDVAELWSTVKTEFVKALDEVLYSLRLALADEAEQAAAVNAGDAYEALETLKKQVPNSTMDKAGEIETRALEAIAAYAKDVLKLADIRTASQISVLRSQSMHGVAKDNAARWSGEKKGLWKVGNDHVADMAKVKGTAGYELLTKDEFNADFTKWHESKVNEIPIKELDLGHNDL